MAVAIGSFSLTRQIPVGLIWFLNGRIFIRSCRFSLEVSYMLTLPTRTADYLTLPDGARVWVQTLNDAQRTDAFEASDLAAARRVMRYRKPGTPDYEVIMTDLIDGGAEMQAGI